MTDNASMFGVGHRAAQPTSTSSSATVVLIVHSRIRCNGARRGGRCNMLQMEQAAEPFAWTCPRCGYRNDSRDGSWVP